ncbi:FHA domain-containing protein [Microcoleus sp. herbarium12]|jgi:predicted component of type VI protein secretion system|uniref:FHA domain-containing protein n=1 Tax=Microcoleus sp. herbarium12 TaxID=3055437 RepID=UPI002FCF7EDB
MYKLTLAWNEGNQERSQTFTSAQATKHRGTIRIGRDRDQCDLVLSETDRTLSRLHVEIFLNTSTNEFWARNLTREQLLAKRNPVIVDGKTIQEAEAPLKVGSQIQLGTIVLKIRAIEQQQQQRNQPSAQVVYGIKCPTGHILAHDYLGLFCPHCGKGIQAGESEVLR